MKKTLLSKQLLNGLPQEFRKRGYATYFLFYLAGGIFSLLNFLTYVFLVWLELHPGLASVLAALMIMFASYPTYATRVFQSGTTKIGRVKFLVNQTLFLLINSFFIAGLYELGVNSTLAFLIVAIPMTLLSFLVQRSFVFKSRAEISQ